MKRLRIFQTIFLSLTLTSAVFASNGEDGKDKTFLDHKLEVVKNEKQATFYRVAEEAGEKGFLARAYFLTGELKMEGYFKDPDITIAHGKFTYFYKNGKVESTGEYVEGQKSGVWKRFGENGAEKPEKIYRDHYEVIIFRDPDVFPSFSGGEQGMMDYLRQHIVYPQPAKEKGIQGVVMVEFVVDFTGAIKNVSVVEGVYPDLNIEAKRVISNMPHWIPGQKDGRNINVAMKMPIQFQL